MVMSTRVVCIRTEGGSRVTDLTSWYFPDNSCSSDLCMTVESILSHGYLYRFHDINEFADPGGRSAFNKGIPSSWARRMLL